MLAWTAVAEPRPCRRSARDLIWISPATFSLAHGHLGRATVFLSASLSSAMRAFRGQVAIGRADGLIVLLAAACDRFPNCARSIY